MGSLGLSRERWTVALRPIPVAMHGARGKPGSCNHREFGRGPEPLIYKNRAPLSLGSSSSSSFTSEKTHIHSFPSQCPIFRCAQTIPPRRWKSFPTNRSPESTVQFLMENGSLTADSGPRPRTIRPQDNQLSPIRINPQTVFHSFERLTMWTEMKAVTTSFLQSQSSSHLQCRSGSLTSSRL